jgi:hypothetical protein
VIGGFKQKGEYANDIQVYYCSKDEEPCKGENI